MSTSGGKIQGPVGGGVDKKGDAGPCIVMAAEGHATAAHGIGHGGHSLPIDLASHRTSGNTVTIASNPHLQSGLVQVRPAGAGSARTFTPGTVTTGGTGPTATAGASGALIGAKGMGIGVGGLGSYSHGGHSVVVTSGGINQPTAPTASIIRQNLTILPARLGQTAVATVTGGPTTTGISTLQFTRGTILGNMRAGTPGQSITVTPLNTTSFGTSIRLAGTVNNGSWIQTSTNPQGAYGPMIRPTTIQISGRTVRPVDGKVIHIPPHGSVQHVTQIQVVDSKGSIIKPSLPTVRGAVHSTGSTPTGTTSLTLPFTLRASIPTLHRPQTTPTGTPVQKVITQSAHGSPIQLVATPKLSQLQAITPIPRLNPVCLTLSSPANQTASNTSPAVAMAPRSGLTGPNLIMTPSLVPSNAGPPVTKVYPISRDLSGSHPVIDMANQHGITVAAVSSGPSSTGVTFSLGGTTGSIPSGHILKAHTLPSGTSSMQMQVSHGNHHLVQVQGALAVQPSGVGATTVLTAINPSASGLPNAVHNAVSSASGVSGTQSYFVDSKNINVSVLHPHGTIQPIAFDKRHLGVSVGSSFSTGDGKGPLVGTPAMILTSTSQPPTTNAHPLGPLQTHAFIHPIPIGSTAGGTLNHQHLTSVASTSLASLTPQQVSIFSTPVSSKQIVTTGQHPVTITMSGVGGPTTYAAHIGQGPVGNTIPSLPAHLYPGKLCPLPMTSVNAASILSATLSMNTNGPSGGSSVVSGPSTTAANSTTTTTAISTPAISTSTTVTSVVSAPAPSPSQSQSQATTKSTLSPRPSILRKREAASDLYNAPLRAQRNLALNFGGNLGVVGNSLSGSVVSGVTPSASASVSASASAAVAAAATANKENNLTSNSGSGVSISLGPISGNLNFSTGNLSILKKEFQPPNEESSWQSCSSNSSSGSTTISTTSETAEIQLQQLQMHQQQTVAMIDLNSSLPNSSSMSYNTNSSTSRRSGVISNTSTNLSISTQNGIIRGSNTASGGARVRTISASKAQNKDIDRLKGKTKDDNVVPPPRKKPRKQQLTTSDLLESASPEISFYQGRKFRKNDLMDPKKFEGFPERLKERLPEAPPPERIVYYIKRPHVSLFFPNQLEPMARRNHFDRYSDVKAKEERRPTITDLANQKNVLQKVTAWKLLLLTCQVDQIVDLEMNVVSSFNSVLSSLDAKIGPNCAARDLNRVQELLKGNIQRCKVIRDQMCESRSQVGKIVEHKSRVQDVINKFASKRPTKKRERERP